MAKICPTCGGNQVGCITCDAPPKRMLPKMDIYTGKPNLRARLFGAVNWEVQGIDISKWNGTMNFAITKTKCQFVIIRAGYGTQWRDANLDANYAGARAQGMPVGLYWYCRPGEDVELTAKSFGEEIAKHLPQLEVHGDFEQTALSQSQTLTWVIDFDDRLKLISSKLQVPYTSKGFWDASVARSTRWLNRKLWDANWTTRDNPVTPLDWTGWYYWQWSANGNRKAAEYGSTGGDYDMDLNRFNGTCAQFNAKYGTNIVPIGGIAPPPIPPIPTPVLESVIINTGELSIRSTPQVISSNIIGHALYNTRWYPYELVNVNGIDWYRVGKNAYISKNYTRPG